MAVRRRLHTTDKLRFSRRGVQAKRAQRGETIQHGDLVRADELLDGCI